MYAEMLADARARLVAGLEIVFDATTTSVVDRRAIAEAYVRGRLAELGVPAVTLRLIACKEPTREPGGGSLWRGDDAVLETGPQPTGTAWYRFGIRLKPELAGTA